MHAKSWTTTGPVLHQGLEELFLTSLCFTFYAPLPGFCLSTWTSAAQFSCTCSMWQNVAFAWNNKFRTFWGNQWGWKQPDLSSTSTESTREKNNSLVFILSVPHISSYQYEIQHREQKHLVWVKRSLPCGYANCQTVKNSETQNANKTQLYHRLWMHTSLMFAHESTMKSQ